MKLQKVINSSCTTQSGYQHQQMIHTITSIVTGSVKAAFQAICAFFHCCVGKSHSAKYKKEVKNHIVANREKYQAPTTKKIVITNEIKSNAMKSIGDPNDNKQLARQHNKTAKIFKNNCINALLKMVGLK
jgi:hypothetical protein